jgi:hypothetical protein
MSNPRLVIVDRLGTVHDLRTDSGCSAMTKLRWEFSQGAERYVPVKTLQALVFKLPGCGHCFGSTAAWKQFLSTC